MKANELMLGDYVQNSNGNIGKVIGCTEYGEVIVRYSSNSTFFTDPNLLLPVPLTPEILEKNGFKPFKVNENESVEVIGKWWGMMGLILVKQFSLHVGKVFAVKCNHSRIANIRNAHEFQNAIRLCGIEKEIVL